MFLLPSREGQQLPDSRFRDAEVLGNLPHWRAPRVVLNYRVSLYSRALQDRHTAYLTGISFDDGATRPVYRRRLQLNVHRHKL